jgi:multiple sugar transport system substrate-binding protein
MKNISNNSNAQIQNALKANQAPDLAQVSFNSLATFRSQNSLVDVSACKDAVAAKDKYLPWTWSLTSFNGDGVFGFPQDIGPMALYYRADLFAQNGLAVPKTWDEYYADAQKVKAIDPNASITYFDGSNAEWFNGLVWQKGGTPFSYTDNKYKVSIDDQQSQAVAGLWQKMIDGKLVRTDLKGATAPLYNAFSENQLWSYVGAAWGYSLLRDNVPDGAGKWRVAPMPSWTAGDARAGNWGGSSVAFMKGGKHVYEAVEFNNWLNSDPVALKMMNDLGGLFPAAKAGADLASFKGGVPYYGDQKIYDVFNKAAANIDTSWQWGPTQTDADTALADGLTKAADGNGKLTDALQASQGAAIKAMQAQSIPVESGK